MEALYERLGTPSAQQLYVSAIRAGLQTTKKQAQEFVAREGTRQTFAKPQPSNGKTAIRSENSDHFGDLIDLKSFKSNTFSAILIVQNPFSRKIAMEPLTSKQPGVVAAAYRTILNRMPKPQTYSSDRGAEFGGPFNQLLEEKGIVHRLKDPLKKDWLGMLDNAIAKVKSTLFQKMTKKNDKKMGSVYTASPGRVQRKRPFGYFRES